MRSLTRVFAPPKRQILTGLLLFGLAFAPRAAYLMAYVAGDEAKWILRSAHFLTALLTGDFGLAASQVATPDVDVLAPAVTTMWTGVLGLLAKYRADGAPVPLIDYLARLPYDHSERLPLDFYPWARFPTILITSLFVVAFYFLLRKLLDHEPLALTAAILLALDPFFVNHSRVIHHDALVTVFVTLALLPALIYLLRDESWGWLVLSGVALGLAVLTKPTALFLAPFIGLMWLWKIYRTRRWRLIGWGFLWAGVGLLAFVAVWPALWGDPLGTFSRLLETSTTAAQGSDERSLIPALIPGRAPELGFLYYPVSWLLRWGILPTLGLALLPFLWRRGRRPGSPATRSSFVWLILFALLLMLALAPLGTRDIRYFLPAWPALIVVAAFGLSQLKGLNRPAVVAILSLALLIPYYPYYVTYFNPLALGPYLAPRLVKVGGGVGLDRAATYLNAQPNIADKRVASYALESFRPYFAGNVSEHKSDDYADFVVNYIRQIQNNHPSPEHIAYFSAREPHYTVRIDGIDYAYVYLLPEPRLVRDVAFGDITLVAQTLEAKMAEPGREYTLTLLWRAPPAAGSTPVRVQVRDAAGQVWSEGRGPLLAPEGPSAVEGHYTLALPPDMPRGDYELWVAVGNGEDWTRFGLLPVHRLSPPAAMAGSLEANFNDLITLGGFDLSDSSPEPGETLALALHWQARQRMARSYTTFVHLVDPAGKLVAQADLIPGGGAWPTDTWERGEWISDVVSLSLPPELPAGTYRLLVGWYYWETGERLPVLNGDNGEEGAVALTSVAVQ